MNRKRVLFALVLVALLVSLGSASAWALDAQTQPVASAQERVPALGTAPVLEQPWQDD
jgi:hypothetical protein